MECIKRFQLVTIGGSAGSAELIQGILQRLPVNFGLPVVIVKHVSPDYHDSRYYTDYLNTRCELNVKEVEQQEAIVPGTVYLAPANYHLLIEKDRIFSLNIDERVNFCRPAIDVLFETASETFGSRLIGLILSGANDDGAIGLKKIKEKGGYTIVQEPRTAAFETMPQAAINASEVDAILPPDLIADCLIALTQNG